MTISVVIPTWQGADVLQDAIDCVLAQSLQADQIIIAIDKCDDGTANIAHDAENKDSRLEVIKHTERVGWVRNTNSGLDAVQGDFFCLYFHDDIIDPDFLKILAQALQDNPLAGSAYCAVEQAATPDSAVLDIGRSYTGDPYKRMLDRLLLPQAGAPLRALTRSSLLTEGLRFLEGSFHGFHAQQAYLLDLIGRNDCVYVEESLYQRRNWRPGALTKGWRSASLDLLTDDLKACAKRMQSCAGELEENPERLTEIAIAIGLCILPALRSVEREQKVHSFTAAKEIVDEFDYDFEFPQRWSLAAKNKAIKILELERAMEEAVNVQKIGSSH